MPWSKPPELPFFFGEAFAFLAFFAAGSRGFLAAGDSLSTCRLVFSDSAFLVLVFLAAGSLTCARFSASAAFRFWTWSRHAEDRALPTFCLRVLSFSPFVVGAGY